MPVIQGPTQGFVILKGLKRPAGILFGPVDSHILNQGPMVNLGVGIPFEALDCFCQQRISVNIFTCLILKLLLKSFLFIIKNCQEHLRFDPQVHFSLKVWMSDIFI